MIRNTIRFYDTELTNRNDTIGIRFRIVAEFSDLRTALEIRSFYILLLYFEMSSTLLKLFYASDFKK